MLIFLLVVIALGAAFYFRVPLLSKALGQDQARVRQMLERRKNGR
ncbi:MAG: hypothetical protein Q7T56_16800 [Nocardioidaceae bacterium]|nr:hypothetical protein [Nocardioidaceae bacterium]